MFVLIFTKASYVPTWETKNGKAPWIGAMERPPDFSWGCGEVSCEEERARNRRSDLPVSTSRLKLSLEQLRDRLGFIGRGHGTTRLFAAPDTRRDAALSVGGAGVFGDEVRGEPEAMVVAGGYEVAEDGVRL
jgi:hypothetical protein